jgi:hypothetical protein
VFTAEYLFIPLNGPLRWTLLPVLPTAVIATGIAALVAWRGCYPRQGWDAFLAFPTSSVLLATAGMLLIGYGLTARVLDEFAVWLTLGIRAGGLLVGIAAACLLARSLRWRLLLAAPLGLFLFTIADPTANGVIGAVYAIAVVCWWTLRLFDLLRSPTATPISDAASASGRVDLPITAPGR